MSAVSALRAATAPDHERVDAVFGGLGLDDRQSYARFLRAHARALPGVEHALAGVDGPPALRPRAALIRSDLADLGEPMPEPLPFASPESSAEAFGMAYVIEGSRLGGTLLSRQVPADLPHRYLAAGHERGEWRGLLAAIDAASAGPDWIAQCVAAAKRTFDLYRAAAEAERA
jgi:heme oxygenase (biliverdin-IX-beta and delta-forming)